MTQLLVSVRSADEALTAIEGGADLIDVKEPANGSLGRADDAAIHAIIRAVGGRRPMSAALGEWIDGESDLRIPSLAYVKWGLAGCAGNGDWRPAMEAGLRRTDAPKLVLVAYADWQCAQAPSVDDVFELACSHPGGVMLIDTCCKEHANGRRPSLLDWLSVREIRRLCGVAREFDVRIALAGSLGVEEIATLIDVQPDWFAVRGAACGSGDRGNDIEACKVRALAELIRTSAPLATAAS